MSPAVRIISGILALDLLVMITLFFRDPDRSLPPGIAADSVLIAPADGRVVSITDVTESRYLKGPGQQLSIFLSVFDVHVNRVPASGEIEMVKYMPGQYLVAWHPKSSELNERAEFGLRHTSGQRVLFRQITGLVARRIVYSLKEGDSVEAGDRFGIMKFGSRMDIVVPPGFEFEVEQGDRVVGGTTVLGHFALEAAK